MSFHGNALVLSGETGTKLKCAILEGYYNLWWNITSGGDRLNHRLPTAIIELNAGTGQDYIEDTGETILGSSGHALTLKLDRPETGKLKIFLVEENAKCFGHLQNFIKDRWAHRHPYPTTDGVTLLNETLDKAIDVIDGTVLGNSLFFFDPLLYTSWSEIERVARKRITSFYKTGTEFIVFLYTSDWFLGRGKLVPLPSSFDPAGWNQHEKNTVKKMDDLFGFDWWRGALLTSDPYPDKVTKLESLYARSLRKWFRYVLPLPFIPKEDQLYHLFICSNYEAGVQITRRYYSVYTGSPRYKPDAEGAYRSFKQLHPETLVGLGRNRKPDQWKIIWTIIRNHHDGLADVRCSDTIRIQPDGVKRLVAFKWLEKHNYLRVSNPITDAWPVPTPPPACSINWKTVKARLHVDRPPPLHPLSPKPWLK